MPCLCTYDMKYLLIDSTTGRFAIVHHNLDRYPGHVLHHTTEESNAIAMYLQENGGRNRKKEKGAQKDKRAPAKDPVSKMTKNVSL